MGATTLAIDGTHTDLTINVINEPDKRIKLRYHKSCRMDPTILLNPSPRRGNELCEGNSGNAENHNQESPLILLKSGIR